MKRFSFARCLVVLIVITGFAFEARGWDTDELSPKSSPENLPSSVRVFGSCSEEIRAIQILERAQFEKRADERQLSGRERAEYIERSVRALYLLERAMSSESENNIAAGLISYVLLNNLLKPRLAKRRELLSDLFDLAGKQRVRGQSRLREHFPFLFELLRVQPPITVGKISQLQRILDIRLSLVRLRAEVSRSFREALPWSLEVTQVPKALLTSVIQPKEASTLSYLIKEHEWLELKANTLQARPQQAREKYQRQWQALQHSLDSPESVREEVLFHDAFDRKYFQPPSLLLMLLVDELTEYLEIKPD